MDGHDSLRKNWIPVLAFLAATLAGPAWSGTAVVFESLPGAATVVSTRRRAITTAIRRPLQWITFRRAEGLPRFCAS